MSFLSSLDFPAMSLADKTDTEDETLDSERNETAVPFPNLSLLDLDFSPRNIERVNPNPEKKPAAIPQRIIAQETAATHRKATVDTFKVGSAVEASKVAARFCADDENPRGTHKDKRQCTPVDYKKLYEESLQRNLDLEQQNYQLRLQQVEISTAKELYLKIFEDFPALIWRSRLDKKCDYFNRTWLEWTGKTLDQEFGFGWTEGVHEDDFDRCVKIYETAFDKREPFYMEYRLMNRDGEYRWIADNGRPFHDLDDTFLGYIGSCYDIHDKKMNGKNECQQQIHLGY